MLISTRWFHRNPSDKDNNFWNKCQKRAKYDTRIHLILEGITLYFKKASAFQRIRHQQLEQEENNKIKFVKKDTSEFGIRPGKFSIRGQFLILLEFYPLIGETKNLKSLFQVSKVPKFSSAFFEKPAI